MNGHDIFDKRWDSSENQARLNALPGSHKNHIIDHEWKFYLPSGKEVRADFAILESLYNEHSSWVRMLDDDLIITTKRIWLSIAGYISPVTYQNFIHGLALYWSALAQLNEKSMTRKNCSEVLTFLLTHQWNQERPIRISGIKSSSHFASQTRLKLLLSKQPIESKNMFNKDISIASITKTLKQIIPKITEEEISYKDWTAGGSYNSLTLDYGRYYVEHCLDFHERHIALAISLASVFRAVPQIAQSLGYTERTIKLILPRILSGYTPHQIKPLANTAFRTINRIYTLTLWHFKTTYQKARFESEVLHEDFLKELIAALGIEPSETNVDRIRIIIWEWLEKQNIAETKRLLNECQTPLRLDSFLKRIDEAKERSSREPCDIPTERDYLNWGLIKPKSVYSWSLCYPIQMINLIKKSGITSLVALTGWRASELGFPLSMLKHINNDDLLDSHSFPYRYRIDWYIFKTHGKVRQQREITFNISVLIKRMHQLVDGDDTKPCLYEAKKQKVDRLDSTVVVNSSVSAMWGHFVKHYTGFKLLDEYKILMMLRDKEAAGEPLTRFQEEQKLHLLRQKNLDEWNNIRIDGNLKETWRRCREEWPKLEFIFNRKYRNKNWIDQYRRGTLNPYLTNLIDEKLSDETKAWLHSLSDNECKSSIVTRSVTNELLVDSIYPTPHAFRHMWAEAVYRRFDGDAGWMIRSQFKHISRSMWLSYIRDKDNRRGHQIAKNQVISSLLNNYLAKGGHGYTGQLHVYLRRLSKKTSVQTPEEQAQFVERIATQEIEDIKANPWGYCLLKRRTRSKARCSEMGEPQRHNASPSLCLGCIHNLMQSTNIDWLLLHISSHVEALKNPVVPSIFKASSFDLVKITTRHVRTLDPDHKALPELQQALDKYRVSQSEAP